jgi:hypothetical protein
MFTDEELEAAVLRYLTSDVETPRSEAGARDIVAAKTQVYEIIAAAFMLRPAAIFSVCWMASNNLRALLTDQLLDMHVIEDAAPRVYKTSAKVDSVTDLHNAEAALLTLTAAFSARSTGVAGGIGPAIARFNTSIDRFVRGELVKNTVAQGDVVQTPEELRLEIASRWTTARARHEEILTAVDGLIGALSSYNAVRLPDTVVGSLLLRIQERLTELTAQMQATTAAQDSRNAMLEFSAMRTLLTQASKFRPPVLQKAPLTGDAQSGVLLGQSGISAGILGAVSGPFNYAPGAVLSYSVGGVPGTLVLPGTSVAELRSRALTAWTAPPVGSECVFLVDGVMTSTADVLAWTDLASAAAGLDVLDGVTVTVDSDQLVFRSDRIDDTSALELLTDTLNRTAFATWLLAGASTSARGAAVPAADVAAAFAADARLRVSVVREVLDTFDAARSTVLGEEATLWHRYVTGVDLLSEGTTSVRAGADLEALGVAVSMLVVTSTPTAQTRRILAVAGPALELDSALPGATYTYYIGVDYGNVELGSRAQLSGSVDAGAYRVVDTGIGLLELDRDLTASGAVQATVVSERLRVEAREVGPAATLGITAGAGATALGLAPGTLIPTLDTFDTQTDLSARGVESGDRLVLEHAAGGPTTHVVASVSGTTVRFSPAAPYEAGALRYVLRDALVQDYYDLREGLDAVFAQEAFDDEAGLDLTMSRLARGARYTGSLVTTLTGYIAALLELADLSDGYSVARDPTVEQALRLMVEQGFDRAADLFVALRLGEFFALDADGVSYKTWVIRTAADVARLVVPVSKDTRDPTSGWRTLAVEPSTFDPSKAR